MACAYFHAVGGAQYWLGGARCECCDPYKRRVDQAHRTGHGTSGDPIQKSFIGRKEGRGGRRDGP